MKTNSLCVLLLFFVFIQSTFAEQIGKVIVSGYGGQHDLDVKTAFLIGYASYNNTTFTGKIILYSNTLQASFNYAVANDYDLIIRSTTGLSTGIRLAPEYPTVELVMPAGSNTYTQVFFGDIITSSVVITGAGVDSNQTGYKLEFYGIDPITTSNSSSFSNGYVAGQLAFISNTLNVCFDSARTLARINGSENGNLDFYNGFGEVQPQNIVINSLPVELTTFTANIYGNNVSLNWQTATEVNNYGFEVERNTPLRGEAEGRGVWEKIGFVNGNGNSNSPKNYSCEDKNVSFGKHSYRLKQIDNDGQFQYSNTIEVDFCAPQKFELSQNYPNPFNPSTTIRFNLPEASIVKLTLYNILGEEMRTLVNEYREAGAHTINFSANESISGIYIYIIEASGLTQTRKMMLIK